MLECYLSTKELLSALNEELTFEAFNDMKSHWLKNMHNEWLIMGHLTEEEAYDLIDEVRSKLEINKHE